MTLKINDETLITATDTKHIALATGDGMWRVSWLPGQELDRNAALTAMTIAELAVLERPNPELDKTIDALSAEIGICGSDAIMLCLAAPMYGLHFTTKAGKDREGFPVSSSVHLAWFDSPEERARFAASPLVASSRNLED